LLYTHPLFSFPIQRRDLANQASLDELGPTGRLFWKIYRSCFKNGFWFKIRSSLCELRPAGKADANIKPEEYIRYFEDLIRAPNAEIGPIRLRSMSYARQEDFFETASNKQVRLPYLL
jgi:hypothetical protein